MKRATVIVFLCVLTLCVRAVPAYRGPIIRTDANGTEQVVYMHGDESFHYVTDGAGRWLDERSLLPLSDAEKEKRLRAVSGARRISRVPQAQQAQPKPAPRGLIILANYNDVVFETPHDTIDSMLNAANFQRYYHFRYVTSDGKSIAREVEATGSARQYFFDQSYGVYNPVFDVVGPVQVSHEMSYYGENDKDGSDQRAGELIKEACEQADAAGVDFTQYDNDNDGYVDFVFVIYAGYGEADGGGENTIWPHQYFLASTGQNCRVDNKQIGRYACSNEINHLSQRYCGIGTFVHEYSHVLGLPDLYETNDESKDIKTLGSWDIMDYGPYNNDGNTPPSYSAYERFYMGWLTPRVLTDPEYVTLHLLNQNKGEALLITEENTHNLVGWNPDPKTFYILEARFVNGWDRYIPGGGMLITKVQYDAHKWKYNQVNNDPNNLGVKIIEAEADSLGRAVKKDAYPAGATEWTALAHHEITDIVRNKNYTINFWYRWSERDEGIEEVQREKVPCTKELREGKIFIRRNNNMYDLNGRMTDQGL